MWGTSVMKRVSWGGGVGRFLSDWRARRKVLLFPSPLVGEGGASRSEATGEGYLSARTEPAERYPSSGASRHLLPQGEKEERVRPYRRGHAVATASKSQLTIKSVPPVGAAKGNRLWPAYCRNVRSAANSAAATTNPNPAAIPIRAWMTPRSISAATART